jgi:hypothetical protein
MAKGDITIDKQSGLVYRDGKILGRKNFIVQLDITHYETKEVVVKAIDEDEAEEKARAIFENRNRNKQSYAEITACWSPD